MERGVRKAASYLSVGTLAVLSALLGALALSLVAGLFSLGLLPEQLDLPVVVIGAGVGGTLGLRYARDAGWLDDE